jgi:acyl-CoA synthetase (AMP-forming)/AMP-acid ligase II
LPGREGHVGVTAKDNRLFVEAVIYRYRAGIPWRDLPERFGDPIKIHTRFSRWAKSGVWKKLFEMLASDADNEYAARPRPRLTAGDHGAAGGYNGNADATARAWRNGWFHTGDAFRRDEAGNFFSVDRIKDAIRRRGENISSFEVEVEIGAHPKVRETAVVGVPSEDEVLAIVAAVPGAEIDPVEIISFLSPRLPHFMVPRYIRFMTDLPKTPTQKVEKHLLRAEGITKDTWDREQAGIRLKREKLAASDLKGTQ